VIISEKIAPRDDPPVLQRPASGVDPCVGKPRGATGLSNTSHSSNGAAVGRAGAPDPPEAHAARRKRLPQSPAGDLLRDQFGTNVRRLRKEKGLTQLELATKAGLGRTFINQVERGHNSVTLETIGAIAAALGERPASLISGNPDAPRGMREAGTTPDAEDSRAPAYWR
jgi:DNA-binding XRE family transcriptional regulator